MQKKNFKKFKSVIIFLGKNKKNILEKALNWSFDYKEKKSITSSESKIIKICNLKKKMKTKIISVINQKGGVGKNNNSN